MRDSSVRKVAFLWLMGWAFFSLPLTGFRVGPRFRHVNLIPFHRVRPLDAARNFAYYVPAGIIGIELGLPLGPTVAIAAGLSAAAETAQIFSRNRFPSATDLVLNTAGAAVGALYWRRRRRRHEPPRPR